MTAILPTFVARRWHLRRTHIRVRHTRIRSMREGYCAKEQHEGQRERATHGIESGFHLITPSFLNNLSILALPR